MLQPYFAFGVPLFLLVLYLLFALIQRFIIYGLFCYLFQHFSWFLVSKYCKNHGPSTLKR